MKPCLSRFGLSNCNVQGMHSPTQSILLSPDRRVHTVYTLKALCLAVCFHHRGSNVQASVLHMVTAATVKVRQGPQSPKSPRAAAAAAATL